MPNKRSYSIETSQNGIDWRHIAGFREGDNSRFGDAKFCDEIAIKEVESFVEHRGNYFKHVRLIIEIK